MSKQITTSINEDLHEFAKKHNIKWNRALTLGINEIRKNRQIPIEVLGNPLEENDRLISCRECGCEAAWVLWKRNRGCPNRVEHDTKIKKEAKDDAGD